MPTWLAVIGYSIIALCVYGVVLVERQRRITARFQAAIEADRRRRREEHARLTEGAPVRQIRPSDDS